MQIILNRIPVRSDTMVKCIIFISNKHLILAFYKGILFRSVTSLGTVLKYPPAKINSKL